MLHQRAALAATSSGASPSRSRILRVWQSAYLPRTGRHVEYMRFGQETLRPVIWLHSFEYPMAPPWGVCVDAAERGYGIVSVRRPGFGGSSSVASLEDEVAILSEFMSELAFEDAVLISEGSARPAGVKLAAGCERIAFTVFARPSYFSETFGDTEPFFRDIILQAMSSSAGARLAMAAIRQMGRSMGPKSFYQNLFKVESDGLFLQAHPRDLEEAWACFSSLKAETVSRELEALKPDPELTRGALAGLRAIAVIGSETPQVWREGFLARSEELGISAALLPQGSLFALYQNFGAVLDLVDAGP